MKKGQKTADKSKLRPQERLYMVLEDLDLSFTRDEITQANNFWQQGVSIVDIAEQLSRDMDEIACLIIDQHRQDRIGLRPGGALGVRV